MKYLLTIILISFALISNAQKQKIAKPVSKQIITSIYKDCDNAVHDKLEGTQDRSPSECEAKYDLDVRTVIHDAIANAILQFKKNSWEVQSETSLSPLTEVSRSSEKQIFRTNYELVMNASPGSTLYNKYQQQMASMLANLSAANKDDMQRFMSFNQEMNGAIKMVINFYVNSSSASLVNFKGGAKVSKVSTGVLKMESAFVAARTGGGEDNAMNATFLLIGNWKQPTINHPGDGSEEVKSIAALNTAAPNLQAQNIFIRLECNAEVANDFIKYLDIQKLQSLLNR